MFVLELFDCGNGRKLFTYIHLALSPELLNNHYIVLFPAQISFSSLGQWQTLSHSMLVSWKLIPNGQVRASGKRKNIQKEEKNARKNPSISSFGK